ncbi:pentatricopeptide repeat-containing protein At4g21065 isoform X1 [Selaginella moellendorffii]|nr:pentatricopeptide repeat-containing protein At4g21065 isoform X1 [Selaginella moellendorffii]|eukprot:XP_002993382.2 pentatricopeptide repeat-containing protein At4g21065 isoform X1 [Selaginella moellendorffii]
MARIWRRRIRFHVAIDAREIHSSSILQGGRTSEKRGKWKAQKELDQLKPPPPLRIGSTEYADRLKRCWGEFGLGYVKMTHERIIDANLEQEKETFLGNCLVRAYGRCKSIDDAVAAFSEIAEKNEYSYAIMMGAYQENDLHKKALQLFKKSINEELQQNQATYVTVLKSCAHLGEDYLEDGKEIHRHAIAQGFGTDLVVQNSLIHMYAKCGSFKFAAGVFEKMEPKNLISYTSMIQAYTHTAKHVEAYELYKKMLSEGIMPDIYAYAAALAVCPTIREGEAIHVKLGNHERRTPVCSNALVGMYGRFGRIASAKWVFDGIRYKDLASYNNMIAVFAKYDDGSKAISLYIEMEGRNLEPNLWTFTSVLDACSKLGALTEGKEIHKKVKGGDQPTDVAYNTALVNMYAKCGSTHEARAVFNDCGLKNVFTWTSLMSAYSQPGQSQYRLEAYQRMNCEGVIPDDVTFTAIFNACSHSGLPDEGLLYFRAMREDHWIVPLQPHYTCMIDLLGRVGRLREAEELVRTMPYSPDVVTWTILLSACKVYGDLKIGARAYKRITELNPPDSGPYLLMGNMYAKAGKWADVAEVKKMIKQRGLAKPPGKSMIEAQRRIHEFVCGDTAHPLNQEIRARLQEVHEQLSHAGYEPDTKEVLVDVNEEVKPELLLFHSERMALGLGLLTSDAGATLHIVKNLRICPDCHSFFKLVSKMLHRKVLVRDSHRFHIFQRGSCSCGDYW